jgi:hypothetical protein
MRRRTAVIGALILAAATGCGAAAEGDGGGDSAGACAEPLAPATPTQVRAGDEVTLTVTGPSGCRDSDPTPEEERSMDDVTVQFWQGDDNPETVVDVRSTGTTFDGTVVVVVPEDARPGPATISTGVGGAGITVLG